MQVDFYNFSKKSNSTKRPTSPALATFDCILKDSCSVIDPVVMLEAGLLNRPAFNYAYIPDFQRYYFITDWVFNRRLWVASLSCDVLATYKPTIGAMNLYILRSSARSNGRVTDNKYPIIAKPYTYIDDIGAVYEEDEGVDYPVANYFNIPLTSGYWYFGILGANGTGVKWYVTNANGWNQLIGDLYGYNPTDMPDVSTGVAKQLADPLQYIVSCYWLPSLIHGAVLDQSGVDIKFGNYLIRLYYSAPFDPVANINKYHASFTLRKHPQAVNRGVYLNQGPYTRYTVVFPPFGTFELDASLMIDDQTASCEWYIDYSTGIADMTIKVTNSFMVHTSAMFGVPIRLNQATFDYVGAGMGTVGGILSAAGSLVTLDIPGMIGGTMSAIGSGLQAMTPKIASKGSTGSFIPFHAISPKLYTDFYLVADEDPTDLGRPLCELVTPSSLGSGFMVAEESHFENTMALENEVDEINAFLTGGFFYE